jgi:hypothetical protein
MNKFSRISAIALASLFTAGAFFSCEKTPTGGEETDNTLKVAPTELSFTAAGETKTVEVTTSLEWTASATTGAEWLTVTKGEGSFTVTAAANETTEVRNGVITVSNGVTSEDKTIAVTQEAAIDPTLTVDPAELAFTAEGETKTVTVTSAREWTASATTGAEWLTVTEGEGSFTVAAAANETTEVRNGVITVSNGVTSEEKTIAVTQAGAEDSGVVFTDMVSCKYSLNGYGMGVRNFTFAIRTASGTEGYQLEIDLVTPRREEDVVSPEIVNIAPGTYTMEEAGKPVTSYMVARDYSFLCRTNAEGVADTDAKDILDSGTVVFEGDYQGYKLTIDLKTIGGKTLKGKYEGTLDYWE